VACNDTLRGGAISATSAESLWAATHGAASDAFSADTRAPPAPDFVFDRRIAW